MPFLLNEYKKIQYLIDSLVLPFIKNQHPKWRELILTYLEFLDDYSLNKALNITDNVNVNDMYSELLDDFLNLYFKDVVDLNKFGLNDDNKRLFISLSKLIGNLKSTKTSFGFFFNSFTDFSIPTGAGDINVSDLVIQLEENPNWWLLNNDPTRPFTYIFKINTPDLTNLRELIKEVHPAGWVQLFLFETNFEDFFKGTDCLELSITFGVKYNGKYKYDGQILVEGTPMSLKYNGGYTVVDDANCDDSKKFAVAPAIIHDVSSTAYGYDQFYPLAGSDQWENVTGGDEWFDIDVDGDFVSMAQIKSQITSEIIANEEPGGFFIPLDSDYEGVGYYGDVYADANFVHIAAQDIGVSSYSVDGGGIFTHKNTLDDGGSYLGVWGDGNFIYAACGNNGLRSYSVDGNGIFTLEDTYDVGAFAQWYRGVWGDGTYIYAACSSNGIRSFSVDGGGNLAFISIIEPYCDRIWGDGNFIYGSSSGLGISSYSVDGGGNLAFIGSVDNGRCKDVWADGNFIYSAEEDDGIRVYSVDGGGNLALVSTAPIVGTKDYVGVWGDGNFIYAAALEDGIVSYSVDGNGDLTFVDVDASLSAWAYQKIHGFGGRIFVASEFDVLSYDVT